MRRGRARGLPVLGGRARTATPSASALDPNRPHRRTRLGTAARRHEGFVQSRRVVLDAARGAAAVRSDCNPGPSVATLSRPRQMLDSSGPMRLSGSPRGRFSVLLRGQRHGDPDDDLGVYPHFPFLAGRRARRLQARRHARGALLPVGNPQAHDRNGACMRGAVRAARRPEQLARVGEPRHDPAVRVRGRLDSREAELRERSTSPTLVSVGTNPLSCCRPSRAEHSHGLTSAMVAAPVLGGGEETTDASAAAAEAGDGVLAQPRLLDRNRHRSKKKTQPSIGSVGRAPARVRTDAAADRTGRTRRSNCGLLRTRRLCTRPLISRKRPLSRVKVAVVASTRPLRRPRGPGRWPDSDSHTGAANFACLYYL